MQVRRISRLAIGIALGVTLWGAALTASAQSADKWPGHPVRIITPAAPGGTTDFLAALIENPL